MKKPALFAVIDVGASAIRMMIAEQPVHKTFHVIESLSQSIRLGVDTFLKGFISQESALATIKILKKFNRVLDDYQVTDCRVVATSAVIEANNRRYFIEYIHRHTGLKIETIESQDECKMIFLSVLNELAQAKNELASNALLVDLGTGNARAVFLQDRKIVWLQSLKLGSLRLREMLRDLDVPTYEYYKVLQAFVQADIGALEKFTPQSQVHQLITTGSTIGDILNYLTPQIKNPTFLKVAGDWFESILEKYKNVSIGQFIGQFNIPPEKADVLLPAVIVYWNFAKIFKPESILITQSSLAEGVIIDKFQPLPNFETHILASARYVNAKFQGNEQHAAQVMRLATQIFEQTHSFHYLPDDYLLILKVAALLHDIGYFVNDRQHHLHSQYLITSTLLTGLTEHQRVLVALVARNHRGFDLKVAPEGPDAITPREQLNITKLIAILRIANALDQSHTDSVTEVQVKFKPEKQQLVFKISTHASVPLETWAFQHNQQLFAELFYVQCSLVVKRILGSI
ncbi:HD domain-containing protein [candidate division KSB1 bacterium]|nr:HD domain-containing protein [candidate division KSB1 bacterium]